MEGNVQVLHTIQWMCMAAGFALLIVNSTVKELTRKNRALISAAMFLAMAAFGFIGSFGDEPRLLKFLYALMCTGLAVSRFCRRPA